MLWNRRSIFARLLPASAAAVATTASRAVGADDVQKVVYHLSDLQKADFVLGNIANHIAGKGGADKVRIVLVVHGPALRFFEKAKANPDVTRRMQAFADDGVGFAACGNTMTAQKLGRDDLLPGFEVATEGGVVRIADLQQQGFVYLRP